MFLLLGIARHQPYGVHSAASRPYWCPHAASIHTFPPLFSPSTCLCFLVPAPRSNPLRLCVLFYAFQLVSVFYGNRLAVNFPNEAVDHAVGVLHLPLLRLLRQAWDSFRLQCCTTLLLDAATRGTRASLDRWFHHRGLGLWGVGARPAGRRPRLLGTSLWSWEVAVKENA